MMKTKLYGEEEIKYLNNSPDVLRYLWYSWIKMLDLMNQIRLLLPLQKCQKLIQWKKTSRFNQLLHKYKGENIMQGLKLY